MSINIIGKLLFCLLLVSVPFVLNNTLKLNISDKLLKGGISLLVLLVIYCAILSFAIWQSHLWITLLTSFLIVGITCVWSLIRFHLKMQRLLIPSLAGLSSVMLILAPVSALLISPAHQSFSPEYFIPIVGMLSGFIAYNTSRGLKRYYVGLRYHAALYYYLLGNGCTHHQAVNYFFRRSLQSTVFWVLRYVSTTVATASPCLLLVLVWAHFPIVSAAILNLMFLLAVLSGSMISLTITLWVARRYTFDKYSRLQPVS